MRRLLQTLPIVLLFLVGNVAHAQTANLPLLNPNFSIVPDPSVLSPGECQKGDPLSFGAVLQLIQNLMNAGIALGVIAFVIVAAYAGASFMLNPTNPEARSHARGLLINVVVGIIIALAGWLVVDFIMKVLYNSSSYGPWNSILAAGSGPACIQKKDPVALTGLGGLIQGAITAGDQTPTGGGGADNGPVLTTGTGACNATTVATAAAGGGVRMSSQEAAILSCVAGPESACGTTLQNYNWNGVKSYPPSTAYGPFQITLKGNSSCFENRACYSAAGVTGPLNCSGAFDSKGYAIPGTALNNCRKAAANLSCSSVAADCVYKKQGAGAWTTDPNSSKQQACITKNGG